MIPNDEYTLLYVRVVFFSLAVGLALTDLYLLGRYGSDGTISSLLRTVGNRWGMFPYFIAFGMGALFCHLFGHKPPL